MTPSSEFISLPRSSKYSRYIRVSLVPNETVEPLVRTLAGHLQDSGGRPLLCVFDRPKTIALKWKKNGEVTEWNPVFATATLEMGIGVELCWPYQARQKGSVENFVGFVKSSFFKVRKFYDEEDLRRQLVEWHREVNEERPCRATGIIPAVRLAGGPPAAATEGATRRLALRIPIYVGPTRTLQCDGHGYSMPPEAISRPATLFLYSDRVRIVAGEYQAEHPRRFVEQEAPGGRSTARAGGRGLGQAGETLFEATAVIGVRRNRAWLPDGVGASTAAGMVGGCRSPPQHSAELRPRSSP